jgi:hypothetical protein
MVVEIRPRWAIVVGLAGVLTACGSDTPGGPTGDAVLQHRTAHFTFNYGPGDATPIAAIATAAEAEWARVTGDLGAIGMPVVTVSYYATHDAMARAVAPIVGAIPAWASGLVTSSRNIHLLSPRASSVAEIATAEATVVHEFAHCVTLHIHPGSANNPRWLWETVAVYESGQRGSPAAVAAILSGAPPTLATLNSFDSQIVYDVGALIGAFIVSRAGFAGLRSLVLANGDTRSVLGLSPDEFTTAWFAWARDGGVHDRQAQIGRDRFGACRASTLDASGDGG